jgi:hypothetical protein
VKKFTTPFEILQSHGNKKQKNETYVAKLLIEKKNQHETFFADLNDPITDNCHLEFITAEDQEAKRILLNSSSIIVGAILQ